MFETENQNTDLDKLKAAAVDSEKSAVENPMMPGKKNQGGRPKLSDEEKARRAAERVKKGMSEKTGPHPSPTQMNENNPFKGLPTEAMCEPLVAALSGLGVTIADSPDAAMSEDEKKACTQALAAIMDKYLPDLGNKFGAELIFLSAFGMYAYKVNTVRVATVAQKKLAKQEQVLVQQAHNNRDPRTFAVQPIESPASV